MTGGSRCWLIGPARRWGEAAVKAHDHFDADDVVVEVNLGGDMATEVIKQAAERVHQRGERDLNMTRAAGDAGRAD